MLQAITIQRFNLSQSFLRWWLTCFSCPHSTIAYKSQLRFNCKIITITFVGEAGSSSDVFIYAFPVMTLKNVKLGPVVTVVLRLVSLAKLAAFGEFSLVD